MVQIASLAARQPVNSNANEQIAKFRKIKLFSELTDAQIQSIAGFFHESTLEKDTIVFYERDLPKETGGKIYFVLSGCVKLVKYSSDGESTIVRLASVGEFFGVTSSLTNQPSPFSAEALTKSTVLSIDRAHFLQAVNLVPKIAVDMLVNLGQVLWFNYETHNQVVKKTDARVCKIILYHMRRDGYQETPDGLVVNIMLPHEYIASMTGIAYEESVRIVSRLKKNLGCINYLRGGKIVITDLKKLKQASLEDEDAWSS
jgi:CRP-like cAMP-binding protein